MDPKFKEEIQKAIITLKKGGIILYPTDTIWGLGCDALNNKAIKKVYKIKQRELSKNMIVLVSDYEMLTEYVDNIPEIASSLINSYQRPLTIIYSNIKNIPKSLINKDGCTAFRITNDPYSKELIKEFGRPIISTSANISHEETPLYFNMIDNDIKEKSDYIVGLYHNSINEVKSSTIIKVFDNNEMLLIRN